MAKQGNRQPRLVNPRAHRPVDWNEAAVQRVIDREGFVIVQAKYDGIRFHAWLDTAYVVRIVTREGIEIKALEKRKNELRDLLMELGTNVVVDGEVVVDGVTFEEGSGLLRRHEPIEHTVKYYIWDSYPLGVLLGEYALTVPYEERRAKLAFLEPWDALDATVQWTWSVDCLSLTAVRKVYAQFREADLEGAVVKDPSLPPRQGKVTGWWKLKPNDTADGIITGYLWGTPGLGNDGKIIGFRVKLEDGTECNADGLTDAQKEAYTQDYWAHQSPPECVCEPLVGRYVEVSFMERTADGNLRHPKFKQLRDLEYAPGVKS